MKFLVVVTPPSIYQIFNYPVVLLVCSQYSPGFWTEYSGTAMLGGFSGCTVATWLTIRLCPCILLALVLYLCTSGMLHVLPSYGCVSGEHEYMSSGITWGLV